MRHENDTKNKIFMVAAHLFAQKGYHGVSMREISAGSGVSKPTIYYYFKSKEGIYTQLLNKGMEQVSESFKKIIALDLSFRERLIVLIKDRFDLCLQYPEFSKFFITLSLQFENNPIIDKFHRERIKLQESLEKFLYEGVNSGELDTKIDPQIAGSVISGTLSYYVWQQIIGEDRILTDQLAEKVVDHIFKGLNG